MIDKVNGKEDDKKSHEIKAAVYESNLTIQDSIEASVPAELKKVIFRGWFIILSCLNLRNVV